MYAAGADLDSDDQPLLLFLQVLLHFHQSQPGEPSVHEHGLLWRLVRASMTIVGLVPPVYHEGDLLVDGG